MSQTKYTDIPRQPIFELRVSRGLFPGLFLLKLFHERDVLGLGLFGGQPSVDYCFPGIVLGPRLTMPWSSDGATRRTPSPGQSATG